MMQWPLVLALTVVLTKGQKDDVAIAAVYLHPETPAAVEKPAWFFQSVNINSSPDVTYFATNGFQYGYGGFQQVKHSPLDGRALFSLWDDCDSEKSSCKESEVARNVVCGTGVKCEPFGGEGTGQHADVSSTEFPIEGQEYSMVIHAMELPKNRSAYTGYFFVNGKWNLMARHERQVADGVWWMQGLYQFIEQWQPTGALTRREADFLNGYVRGSESGDKNSFHPIEKTRWSYQKTEDYTHEDYTHVNGKLDPESRGVIMGTGGDISRTAEQDQIFPLDVQKLEKPLHLVQLEEQIIPCLEKENEKSLEEGFDLKGYLESCLTL